jgi:hypothetical protein
MIKSKDINKNKKALNSDMLNMSSGFRTLIGSISSLFLS